MTDDRPDREASKPPQGLSRWQTGVLGAVSALVIGVYVVAAHSGVWESLSLNPADSYYNLLVQGFRAGQLSLNKEVPAGLAQLADPYDPVANGPYRGALYRLHDMSYYKGRLYLYFGVTPALILFWPFVWLTGHYLFHQQALAICCSVGYLTSVGILCALWRRYFPRTSVWVVSASAVALGLASSLSVLAARAFVYEVTISCGYMLTMLALGGIWCALHDAKRRAAWLAAASLACGLAVGARPLLGFGAIILLVPVALAWHERQPVWPLLIAAISPILLIGLGLMLYNATRFDNPLEFGVHYQLAGARPERFFSGHYLWYNFRVYFLEPVRWSGRFPFVRGIAAPPSPPAGYGIVEDAFGALTNVPVTWLALAAPLAWRGRPAETRRVLPAFLIAVALLLGINALTLSCFFFASVRYEAEFLPALVILAVVGIFGLERTLADRRAWLRAVRWGWALLLAYSVAFNLFATVAQYAQAHYGRGVALLELRKFAEARDSFEETLRINPNFARAQNDLGFALEQTPEIDHALEHYQEAVRLRPELAEAHYNLANALVHLRELDAAIRQYQEVLRLEPNHREVYYNLGEVLLARHRMPEAISQFEQALRVDPAYADAHEKLGKALALYGRRQDALAHFEEALQLNPQLADAENGLANVLVLEGKTAAAIPHYERALQIKPDSAATHCNLASALERLGRVNEAREHYQQALRLNPASTAASEALARLQVNH
jgi:tetratricopeptide (TPR) repeat protein